jgi:phage-related protein
VEEFIRGLSKQDQARFVELFEGIEEFGLAYPRAGFRQLDGKLWEIKFVAPGGGYRIAYVLLKQDSMVWLHVFKKKSQKTSRADLQKALKRAGEVLR